MKLLSVILWVSVILYWLYRARNNKPTKKISPHCSLPFLKSGAAAALAGKCLETFIPGISFGRLVPDTAFSEAVGFLVFATGVLLGLWARSALGGNWSGLVELKEDHALILQGPYKYMRHPIYTAVLLSTVGTAALFSSTPFLLAGIVMFARCAFQARYEELLMVEAFGDAYRSYRERVKAFVPYLF